MPFSALKRLIADEKIEAGTLSWRKGLPEWLPADKIPELQKLFAVQPPELPPMPPPIPSPLTESAPVTAEEAEPEAPEETAPAPEADIAPEHEEARKPPPTTLEDIKDKGTVKGEVLSQLQQVEPDEEPTDQEVLLDEVDRDFFSAGQDDGEDLEEEMRGLDEIELSDGPLFPVEIEQQIVEKGAKASLKDFSVMVRISKRSRVKSVGALVGIAVTAILAVVLIFTFGDPLGWADPEKEEIEMTQGEVKYAWTEVENRRKEQEQKQKAPTATKEKAEEWNEPDDLVKVMHEKEWRVSLDEEEMAIDREKLASQLKSKKKEPTRADSSNGKASHKNTTKKKTVKKKHKETDSGDEMSLEEYAMQMEKKSKANAGSLISSAGGTKAKKGKEKVADEMSSSMGSLLGSKMKERKVTAAVKEREGDGSALKALVARRVGQKVGGERKKLQRCVETHGFHGSGGKLRASLHFSDKGIVSKVTIKGGSGALEKCFTGIFAGWRISTINRKIKIPIAVRFE